MVLWLHGVLATRPSPHTIHPNLRKYCKKCKEIKGAYSDPQPHPVSTFPLKYMALKLVPEVQSYSEESLCEVIMCKTSVHVS